MNVVTTALQVGLKYGPLVIQAIEMAYDYAKQRIDERELAQRAINLAVDTGVASTDLADMLRDADAAATEERLRRRQQEAYGASEPRL